MNNCNLYRLDVLVLYKQILRLSKNWVAINSTDTEKERAYIREEARNLFRLHATESNPGKIKELLQEGQKRVEIARHYGIPYERPHYLPPLSSYDVNLRTKSFKQRKPRQTLWN